MSNRFGELSDRLKSTYRKVADEQGPSEDDIKEALGTLAGAWSQIAESVSDILRDPETREGMKRAVSSLAGALGSTLSDLGNEFREGARPDGEPEDE